MHNHVHVENKRSIRDWIEQHKKFADMAYLDGHPMEMQQQLEQSGFTKIRLINAYVWKELHDWCRQFIGEDHYTWFGSTFWFSCEKDAIMFDLKWNHNANN